MDKKEILIVWGMTGLVLIAVFLFSVWLVPCDVIYKYSTLGYTCEKPNVVGFWLREKLGPPPPPIQP